MSKIITVRKQLVDISHVFNAADAFQLVRQCGQSLFCLRTKVGNQQQFFVITQRSGMRIAILQHHEQSRDNQGKRSNILEAHQDGTQASARSRKSERTLQNESRLKGSHIISRI